MIELRYDFFGSADNGGGIAQMAGLPDARRAFVPMPVMGKTTEELKAYVYGKDPITGLPVMQEVIAGLTTALSN